MKHSSTVYAIQRKDGDKITNVAHSQSDDGEKFYCEFLDRKKALSLMMDELKLTPNVPHRLVKTTTTVEFNDWTPPAQ